jgi:predicted alpha/beta hydrolase family esterase
LLDDSLEDFHRAQQLDPESKETQEWITYLEKEMQKSTNV